MKPPVGLIGLGLMGHPMGANLLKAGHQLTVWNRTSSRGDDLVAKGAKWAATPRAVAAASEVVITIVSDPPAVESVLWGENGVFAGLKRGSVIIESSTVSPALEKRAALAAAAPVPTDSAPAAASAATGAGPAVGRGGHGGRPLGHGRPGCHGGGRPAVRPVQSASYRPGKAG